MTEDEMVGWYHQLNGHEFEQTSGDSEGQGSLACCSPWSCKELDMEQQTSSKSGKEYAKAVYCHPAVLTYMQSTSCKVLGWMKHKLESKLPGEISIISDTQMTLGHTEVWEFSSVAQSCPILCNSMDCSMPGFPVHHQLLKLEQTHVH